MADIIQWHTPKPRRRPYVIGTWTTGCNVTGLHGFPGHLGHIIVVESLGRKEKYSNSGYQQDAHCLRCGTPFKNCDGEFLQERAGETFIHAELEEILALRARMGRVARIIGKEMTT